MLPPKDDVVYNWKAPDIKLETLNMSIDNSVKMGVSMKAEGFGIGFQPWAKLFHFGMTVSSKFDYFNQGNNKFSADLDFFFKYQSNLNLLFIKAILSGYVSQGHAFQSQSSLQGQVDIGLTLTLLDWFQFRGYGLFSFTGGGHKDRADQFWPEISAFAFFYGKKNGFGIGYQMNNDNTVVDDRIKQYLVLKYIRTLDDNTQQSFEVKLLDKDGPVVGGSLSYKL
ncbi:MAG TPA: hypothetical protein PK297_12545 [Spirochaetota bacterium]|nr:hypothetical protein [Spirochaetota bacterium]